MVKLTVTRTEVEEIHALSGGIPLEVLMCLLTNESTHEERLKVYKNI